MTFRFLMAGVVMYLGLDSGQVQGIESWFDSGRDWMLAAVDEAGAREQAIADDLAFDAVVDDLLADWEEKDGALVVEEPEEVAVAEVCIPEEEGRLIEELLVQAVTLPELPEDLFAADEPVAVAEVAEVDAPAERGAGLAQAVELTREAVRAWMNVLATNDVREAAR
jgi:hypothetical protein